MTSYLYLVNFSEGEVAILSCCSRYLSTYFVAVFLFVLYSAFCITDYKYWYLFCISIFFTHMSIGYTFLSRFIVSTNEAEKKIYYEVLDKRNHIEKIEQYVGQDEKLYVFNAANEVYNYALTPIWVVPEYGTNQNDIQTFMEDNVFNKFDYVYFSDECGTIETKEFIDEYGYLFEETAQICDNGLYQVVYIDDELRLNLVSEIQ